MEKIKGMKKKHKHIFRKLLNTNYNIKKKAITKNNHELQTYLIK